MSTLLRELEISKLASIKWDDSVTFTLPQLLQVYPLPQIVKIDKALSSKSDNSTLCKDTILCLHSNIPIQKVHGHLSSDKEKQISIPLDCRRKVEVRPWKLKDVYENVKELFSVFPKYVRVSKGKSLSLIQVYTVHNNQQCNAGWDYMESHLMNRNIILHYKARSQNKAAILISKEASFAIMHVQSQPVNSIRIGVITHQSSLRQYKAELKDQWPGNFNWSQCRFKRV